jgi:hypothetical protein
VAEIKVSRWEVTVIREMGEPWEGLERFKVRSFVLVRMGKRSNAPSIRQIMRVTRWMRVRAVIGRVRLEGE